MKERGILFSGAMVCALVAGTKTQTRRIVKPQPARVFSPGDAPIQAGEVYAYATLDEGWMIVRAGRQPRENALLARCPYGLPGDTLWVRETTYGAPLPNFLTGEPTNATVGFYSADDEEVVERAGFNLAWWYSRAVCPAIHMPRVASRITLRMVDVRVERLNEISEADALAEGVIWSERWSGFVVPGVEHPNKDFPVLSRPTAREQYAALWDTINGPGAWLGNPWVWVYTFARI